METIIEKGTKTLHITLKKKWFDMIANGEKKEEYREIKPYWVKRLLWMHDVLDSLCFDELTTNLNLLGTTKALFPDLKGCMYYFTCEFAFYQIVSANNGYAKDCPNIKWKHKSIRIGEGKQEWGAEPGKQYFILEIGELIIK